MSKQLELIERIRKEKFGIGVELHGDAKTLFDNAMSWIRNLLRIIAEDLYSKESHFVLELVQNADDNRYEPGVDPSLSFVMESNRLIVVNNETGFEEKHVRALCSAGESSKSKEKAGYIGEKGIGFKSIFKVTDSPEIHSNGFHFRFDRSNSQDLLGYVVPHWQEPDLEIHRNATTLVIPSKQGHVFSPETLASLSDPLLLFLRKLRHLEVLTAEGKSSYRRLDKEGSITTLVTSKPGVDAVRQNYLRKTITVDMSAIKEPKREGIKETEVVLAFPLSNSGEAAPLPGCATYAFLPIRDFGFNFYIQADFVLVSSREGIHEDQPWNLRLRDAIADAFVESVEEFKKQPALAKSFLKYLPSKEEVHDPFFAPVVSQIIDKLKDSDCIPVAGGGWRKPAKSIVSSNQIRQLFTSKDAVELFGADHLKDEFYLPSELRTLLGCRLLEIADVVALFATNADWLKAKDVDWIAGLYAYFACSPNRAEFVKQLKKVACVRIEGGEMTVPEKDMVFFPLNASKKYGFEHELNILDNDLLERARGISSEVDSLFEELDVRHDNPWELIRAHILPRHSGEAWKSGGHEALVGHLRYIKDRFAKYVQLAVACGHAEAEAITVLRDGLWVGTKKEDGAWTFGRANTLYLSTDYRPEFDIEMLLGDEAPKEKLISPKYLRKRRKASDAGSYGEELSGWRDFFVRLGVNVSPKVVKQASGNVVCSSELEALLGADGASVRRVTLQALDRNWAEYPTSTTYYAGSGRNLRAYTTGLASSLRSALTPTRQKGRASLSEAFYPSNEVKDILGDSVIYVDAELGNLAFMEVCGISYKVDAAACLKRLRQIKATGGGSLDQVRKIYRRLESIWEKEKTTIEHAFAGDRLIRVGRRETTRWVLPSEACWNPTNVDFLDSRYPPLSGPYREHQTFFTKRLMVPAELALQNWVDGLKEIDDADLQERERVALAIYRRLSRALDSHSKAAGHLLEPDWLSDLDTYSLLLNKRGEMVDRSEHLYADDMPETSTLFEDVEAVSFLFARPEHLPSLATLLDALEIKRVSEAISIEVAEDVQGNQNVTLTEKLRSMLIPIARIVYNQSHSRFDNAIKDGLFNQLNEIEVVEVESLVLSVFLADWCRETPGKSAIRRGEILLDSAAPSKIDYVAIEVEKLLGLNRGASDAIGRLLMSESVEAANAYLVVRNTSDIPEEDLKRLIDSIGRKPITDLAQNINEFAEHPGDEEDPDAGTEASDDVDDYAGPMQGGSTSANIIPAKVVPTPGPQIGLGVNSGSPDALRASAAASTQPGESADDSGRIDTPVQKGNQVHNPIATRESVGTAREPSRGSAQNEHRKLTETGHLKSYVMPKRSGEAAANDGRENEALAEHKRKVEEAAVAFFINTAAGYWKSMEVMPPNNPGYDIKAVSMDGQDEFIEVKGQGKAWTEAGVALTPTELRTASDKGERYWLCVVEHALDASRRLLWLVQDPFGKANQFRFDRGWQDVATRSEGAPLRPAVGMWIDIPSKGCGRIIKVEGTATLTRVGVLRDDKTTFFTMFHPATMKLRHH